MKSRKIVRLTAIFWILTFVGQAIAASAVHCNMQLMMQFDTAGEVDHSQMDHSQMDHSAMGHDMSSMNQESPSTSIPECCQLGADCSEGNCSYVYLSQEVDSFEVLPIKTNLIGLSTVALFKRQSSLYRPPIIA